MQGVVELEMRPVYVRRAERTSAHALVVMLAYRIVQALAEHWNTINLTVEEGLRELATLCTTEVQIGAARCYQIPQPRERVQQLFDLAHVRLPPVLPCRGLHVATRKQLPENRKRRLRAKSYDKK